MQIKEFQEEYQRLYLQEILQRLLIRLLQRKIDLNEIVPKLFKILSMPPVIGINANDITLLSEKTRQKIETSFKIRWLAEKLTELIMDLCKDDIQDTISMLSDSPLTLTNPAGIKTFSFQDFTPDPKITELIVPEIARKYTAFPVAVDTEEERLTIAVANPSDIFGQDDMRFLTGYEIKIVISTEKEILAAIEKFMPHS